MVQRNTFLFPVASPPPIQDGLPGAGQSGDGPEFSSKKLLLNDSGAACGSCSVMRLQ